MRFRSTPSSFGRARPPEPASHFRVLPFATVFLLVTGLIAWERWFDGSLSPITWYLIRSSGITLYLLLWLTVMLGLGLTTSALDRFGGRAVIFSLHRFVTELAYAGLALHLATLALDDYVPFGLTDLLVPFRAMDGDPWVALGVIAAWGMVIIGFSYSFGRIIGYRGWRALHALAFPLYLIALLHGIGAGSDRASDWLFGLYLGTFGAVCFLTTYRLLRGRQRGGAPVMPPRSVPATTAMLTPNRSGDIYAHPADRR
jgi:sulfoxide reductase heme-binding subunit YedZ